MSADWKIVLIALANAVLITLGVVCQKINTVRGGHPAYGPWLILALAFFIPTFFITNWAFQLGGRMSLYVPVTSANFVLISLAGWIFFGETLSRSTSLGLALIVAGITLVAVSAPEKGLTGAGPADSMGSQRRGVEQSGSSSGS